MKLLISNYFKLGHSQECQKLEKNQALLKDFMLLIVIPIILKIFILHSIDILICMLITLQNNNPTL